LFIGGSHIYSNTTNYGGIAAWNGDTLSYLEGIYGGLDEFLINDNAASVKSIISYKGDIYAGGHFYFAGGDTAQNIARWDGSNWHCLENGLPGSVSSFYIWNDTLYRWNISLYREQYAI
jgi:hypothetical protein